jgi:hypothetical protein
LGAPSEASAENRYWTCDRQIRTLHQPTDEFKMAADTRTAEESRTRNIGLMGEPLGEIYSALWQELASVHANWAEYVVLFGTKPSRVMLVNKAAPYFFQLVQDTLWEAVLLHMARLTDPYDNPKKPVLSVQRLPDLIIDPALKASVKTFVAKSIDDTKFCRDWRNRHIAHRDLALSLASAGAKPLASASRLQVKAALQSLADVLNAVSKHYRDGPTHFDLHHAHDGAQHLLPVLNEGVAGLKARIERRKNGTDSPDDWRVPDL